MLSWSKQVYSIGTSENFHSPGPETTSVSGTNVSIHRHASRDSSFCPVELSSSDGLSEFLRNKHFRITRLLRQTALNSHALETFLS